LLKPAFPGTRLLLFTLLLVLPAGLAGAAESAFDKLRADINAFKQGEDHFFAPSTIARAEAYLGAALLAKEDGKEEEAATALAKAREKLQEARSTTQTFRTKHAQLLRARQAAMDATAILPDTINPLDPDNPQVLTKQGDAALSLAVQAMEAGQLNQSQEKADQALDNYQQALNTAIPILLEQASSLLSRASSASVKRYAPQTWQMARDEIARLRSYADGLSDQIPTRPSLAVKLAEQALLLARQVREWRKHNDSHEKLFLEARRQRVKLAEALGMPVETDNPLADVAMQDLLQAATTLRAELKRERSLYRKKIEALEQQHEADLQARLAAQRQELLSTSKAQLASMKEAFRAKLERETFEKKRLEQVRKLFKKGEVDILVHADGSLLIRLVALKFPSGKSEVAQKYFDLLARVKAALDIYGDRHYRIEGHTDNRGDVKLNQKLSLKRAEAVRDFLIAAGLDPARVKALGYGEVRPIASNEFARGRAMNRRIDIVIEPHD